MEDWIEDKWYPAHTRKTLEWVLNQKTIPIYPKSMEKIIGKIPITSFHVTTLDHLDNVKKLLGSKKSFSGTYSPKVLPVPNLILDFNPYESTK